MRPPAGNVPGLVQRPGRDRGVFSAFGLLQSRRSALDNGMKRVAAASCLPGSYSRRMRPVFLPLSEDKARQSLPHYKRIPFFRKKVKFACHTSCTLALAPARLRSRARPRRNHAGYEKCDNRSQDNSPGRQAAAQARGLGGSGMGTVFGVYGDMAPARPSRQGQRPGARQGAGIAGPVRPSLVWGAPAGGRRCGHQADCGKTAGIVGSGLKTPKARRFEAPGLWCVLEKAPWQRPTFPRKDTQYHRRRRA